MTSQQEQVALQEKLREVLGIGPATTMMSMFEHEELATKTDLIERTSVLHTEMGVLRTEMGVLRTEMADLRTELKTDMADLRTELRTGMGEVRSEVASLRQEMELKYATKDDLFAAFSSVNETISAQTRTFIVVQAATVVGMSGILYGFLRLG